MQFTIEDLCATDAGRIAANGPGSPDIFLAKRLGG